MTKFKLGIVALLIFTLWGCEREEKLYEFEVEETNSEILNLDLGTDYSSQVFVDLGTMNTLKNDFRVWDIALPSDISKLNIRINDANVAYLAVSMFNNIYASEPLPKDGWSIDESCGSKDSCAIGEWFTFMNGKVKSKKLVYILDRGELAEGERYYKFQILNYDSEKYTIKYGKLNGTDFDTKEILINQDKNYNYFSFENERVEKVEELDKNDWDIVFKPYRHVFYDMNPVLEYLVVGALINPNNVKVYKCTTMDYADIGLDYAIATEMSHNWDGIGYDWKEFDRNTNKYSITPNIVYILKDTEGVYYKLRFISFYNELGEKGYPKFEFKRI